MKNYFKPFFAVTLTVFTMNVFGQGNPPTPPQTIGQDVFSNPIQTAVPFMRIAPDARSGGMGETALAVKPDANALFWNSAKLPFIEDQEAGIALNYTPWLASLNVDDVHFINVGGFYKLDDDRALNMGVRYFSMGDTEFRRTANDPAVIATPQEFSVQAGYSQKLSDVMGLGVNLKYIHSDLVRNQASIQNKPGSSVAGDINWYLDPEAKGNVDLAFAATLSNLGAKISYLEDATNADKDFLPTNLGLGASANINMNEYSDITFALDANKLLVPTPESLNDTSFREQSVVESLFSSWGDAPGGFSEELREFQVSLGSEYNYNDQFFGRAGYFYEHQDKGGRQFATLGAGVKFQIAEIDFAYLFTTNNNNSPLDKTLRFGVKFDVNTGGSKTSQE